MDVMENPGGNPGINMLANVLSGRMKKENESPLVLDFGEIQANGSLLTNTFPVPVPRGIIPCAGTLPLERRAPVWQKQPDLETQEMAPTATAEAVMEDTRQEMVPITMTEGSISMRCWYRRRCGGSSPGTGFWWHGCRVRRLLWIS